MKQLSVNYSIKISEKQSETLKRLRDKYKVNPNHFIRDAISEKLQREKLTIKEKLNEILPF